MTAVCAPGRRSAGFCASFSRALNQKGQAQIPLASGTVLLYSPDRAGEGPRDTLVATALDDIPARPHP